MCYVYGGISTLFALLQLQREYQNRINRKARQIGLAKSGVLASLMEGLTGGPPRLQPLDDELTPRHPADLSYPLNDMTGISGKQPLPPIIGAHAHTSGSGGATSGSGGMEQDRPES